MSKNKNNSKSDKTTQILLIITAILAFLFILSFTKSCSSADKREMVKTALVNQKYKDNINTFILQDATGLIELSKQNGFWTVQSLTDYSDNQTETNISLPASSERIHNFINELIKVRSLYKISDKINKNSSLGLTNGTEFHIRYNYNSPENEKTSFRELIFGNQDFSLSSRYMMSGESTQVYEINDSMDVYLTTASQSWAEPYIISKTAISTDIQNMTMLHSENNGKIISKLNVNDSNISKLLDLRHGGLPSKGEVKEIINKTNVNEIEIENGDKSRIIIEIYSLISNENTYIVKVRYFKPDAKSAFYESYSKISTWTYNKIKEITL